MKRKRALHRLIRALDPAAMMTSLGMTPDPWQLRVLQSTANRVLMLCARQTGKSTATAILALHTAVYQPGSLTLLVSPSLRQSSELYRKLMGFYQCLGRPRRAVQETAVSLTLANGSRVVSLPASPETIRGYSAVTLLVVDEAALVPDEMFVAINPMLATSRGRLVCLSTPVGQRGWFYEAWTEPGGAWERHRAVATVCPRVSAEFLAEQRETLGERWYRQEYECSFESTLDQFFPTDAVLRAFTSDEAPLFDDESSGGWAKDLSWFDSTLKPLFAEEPCRIT